MASKIIVKLPDGSQREYLKGMRLIDVFKDVYTPADSENVIAGIVNDKPVDLACPLDDSAAVRPVSLDSKEGLEIFRHSASHVMAQAVKELFGDSVKVAIGPSIEEGFYYDFDSPTPFTPDDLEKIEKRMREIIKKNRPFERIEMSKIEAL